MTALRKIYCRWPLALIAPLLVLQSLMASEPTDSVTIRPVTNAVTLTFGGSKIRDTYLTPLLYEGTGITVQFDRWRRMRNTRLTNQQIFMAGFSGGEDKSHNSETWAGRFLYRYALHFGLLRDNRWTLLLGPYANSEIGFNYNLKLTGSNNPATVRWVSNFGASAAVGCHYQLLGYPCTALLQAQTPLIGAAVMPEYGASYYETFYLETTDATVHNTSLHNQQDLDIRLTTDVPLAVIPWFRKLNTTIRIGFQYHIETMKINDITTRYSTIGAVVGWSYQYIPYHRSRRNMLRETPLAPW